MHVFSYILQQIVWQVDIVEPTLHMIDICYISVYNDPDTFLVVIKGKTEAVPMMWSPLNTGAIRIAQEPGPL